MNALAITNTTSVKEDQLGNYLELVAGVLSLAASLAMLALFAILPKLRRGPLSAIMYSAFCDLGWSLFCLQQPICALLPSFDAGISYGLCDAVLNGVPCETIGCAGTFFGLALYNWYGVICLNVLLTIIEFRFAAVDSLRRMTIKRRLCCAPGGCSCDDGRARSQSRNESTALRVSTGGALNGACRRRGRRLKGRVRRCWNSCELRDESSGDVNLLALSRHLFAWIAAAALSIGVMLVFDDTDSPVFGPTKEFPRDEECWITKQRAAFRFVLYGPMMFYVVFACCLLITSIVNCRALPKEARTQTFTRMTIFVFTFAALWTLPFIDRVVGLVNPNDSPEWLQIAKNVAIALSGFANFLVWSSSIAIRRKIADELHLPFCRCDQREAAEVTTAQGNAGWGRIREKSGASGLSRSISKQSSRERDGSFSLKLDIAAAESIRGGGLGGEVRSSESMSAPAPLDVSQGVQLSPRVSPNMVDDDGGEDEEEEEVTDDGSAFAWADRSSEMDTTTGRDAPIPSLRADPIRPYIDAPSSNRECARHVCREVRFCCCCVCEDLFLCNLTDPAEYADSESELSRALITFPERLDQSWDNAGERNRGSSRGGGREEGESQLSNSSAYY